jgi:archaemetzincin
MLRIDLVPVGKIEKATLEELAADLEAACDASCGVLASRLDAEFAYHPEREQFHSSEILARLSNGLAQLSTGRMDGSADRRLLGVTTVDLYIPILTFVFGEAQMGDTCAVVSTHRLRQEFYGLPSDADMLRARLLKEALHEIGHTLALPHCEDYLCAMAPSHSVEWIDLKGAEFCPHCASRMRALGHSVRR